MIPKNKTKVEKLTPTLKWVGGKRRLSEEIIAHFPSDYGTYFEPFLGGASIFFAAKPRKAVLADVNSSLINYYQHLRDFPDRLFLNAKDLEANFNSNMTPEARKENYYSLRAEFNKIKNSNSEREALLFLFLNKTSFNGLYRENSRGEFNVPFNNSEKLILAEELNFRANSLALAKTKLKVCGFENGIRGIKSGDLVYFDPPYVPLSRTADFTDYTKSPFDFSAQKNLRDVALKLVKNGVFVLLSNSFSDQVQELYSDFQLHELKINRLVSASSESRRSIGEYLIVGDPNA